MASALISTQCTQNKHTANALPPRQKVSRLIQVHLLQNYLLDLLQKCVARRWGERFPFPISFGKNGLEVYAACNQVATNLMPRIPNFAGDQHDICIDIICVSFLLSFCKCQWLFRIIDNPGRFPHLHVSCQKPLRARNKQKIPLIPLGIKRYTHMTAPLLALPHLALLMSSSW